MTDKEKAIIEILKSIKDDNPDSFVYVVPNLFTKKMKSFMLIREDLKFISEIIVKLIAHKNNLSPDKYLCFGLWQSVIVNYGKCFTENKSGLSKLEKAMLDGQIERYQHLHDT